MGAAFRQPGLGKRCNAGLGSYLEVSIADATKLGQSMRDLLAAGSYPLDTKKPGAEKPSIPSFELAAW
jgi:hypothetical protein